MIRAQSFGLRASALCCVVLACGVRERPSPSPSAGEQGSGRAASDSLSASAQTSSDSPPVGALVVIAEEADLLASPDDRGLRFAVPLNRTTDLTPGHVVEVVGIEGELVGVRTLDGTLAHQCAGSFGIEAELELRFWVARGSLRTVLSRAARVEFDDGTSVALVPGVPVSRFEDRISAHVGGLKLPIELDDDALALSFTPAAAEADQPRGWALGTIAWGEMAELRYGEHVARSRGGVFTRAIAQRDAGEAVMLSFANPCGRFELLGQRGDRLGSDVTDAVPELPSGEAIDLDKARRAAGISPLQADVPLEPCARWDVAANTPLEWTDGTAAGRTRQLFTLSRAPIVDARRACFDAVPGFAVCCEATAATRRVEPNCE